MNCPQCGSTRLEYSIYEFQMDPQTGYVDSGEVFFCPDCGAKGLVDEYEVNQGEVEGEVEMRKTVCEICKETLRPDDTGVCQSCENDEMYQITLEDIKDQKKRPKAKVA